MKSGDINLLDAYATDSELKQYNLKVLEDEMRKMNYEVNVEGKSSKDVAKEYLEKEGLLK
ncbi:hypothetical protein [Clostridium algidicarnis]|uniref:hypothetical protein n=1 Tax=Clostridium algidicarnis TaxID=37659 RepID=UPI003FD745E5